MNDVRLVVLAHYPDIFEGFYESVNRWEPELRKVLVRDGVKVAPTQDWHWLTLNGELPFNYSRNVNIGWKDAAPYDVLLCGDDIRFDGPFLKPLQDRAYSDDTIGITVPELNGQSPFVCMYVKRSVLDIVGLMEEEYDAYGFQDNSWCRRMELKGFHTQPVLGIDCHHQGGETFYRRVQEEGGEPVHKQCERMREIYEQKWGQPKEGPERWLQEGHGE